MKESISVFVSLGQVEERELEKRISILRLILLALFAMFGPLLPGIDFFSPGFLSLTGFMGTYAFIAAMALWFGKSYRPFIKYVLLTLDLFCITILIKITPGQKDLLTLLYFPIGVAFGAFYRFWMAVYINLVLTIAYLSLTLLEANLDVNTVTWEVTTFYLFLFWFVTLLAGSISSYHWQQHNQLLNKHQTATDELKKTQDDLTRLWTQNRGIQKELDSRISELRQEKEASEQQRVQAETRAWEIATIHNVTSAVNNSVDLQEILNITVEKFSKILQLERVDLILFDQTDHFGYVRAFYGRNGSQFHKIGAAVVSKSNPLVSTMVRLQHAIALDKTTKLRDEWVLLRKLMKDEGFNALLLLPITINGELIGIIQLNETRKEKIFTPQEVSLCETLVEQASNAIQRGMLVQETLQKSVELEQVNVLIEAEIAEKTFSEARLAQLAKVANSILQDMDLTKVFNLLAQSIVEFCGFARCMVVIIENQQSDIRAHAGYSDSKLVELLNMRLTPEKRRQILNPALRRSDSYFIPEELDFFSPKNLPLPPEDELVHILERTTWQENDAVFVPLFDSERQMIGLIILDDPTDGKVPSIRRLEPVEAFAKQAVFSLAHVKIYDVLQTKLVEIQGSYDKLVEVDQLKSDFLSVVSHELRTPLTSIKSFTEILIDEIESDEEADQGYLRFLNIIDMEADRLSGMINDILSLQQIQDGRYVWLIEEIQIHKMAREMTKTYMSRMNKQKINLHTTIPEHMPSYYGDSRKIKEMLDNLLSNALKFTPENGNVYLALRFEDDIFLVSIKDTGEGIPKDKLQVIFEKFQQVDGSARRKVGGVGLGLSIVKEIVTHHGGFIEVKSEIGIGSEFIIRLPKTEPLAKAPDHAETAPTDAHV